MENRQQNQPQQPQQQQQQPQQNHQQQQPQIRQQPQQQNQPQQTQPLQQSGPIVVKASKDKKKINQKVRRVFVVSQPSQFHSSNLFIFLSRLVIFRT